MGSGPVSGEVRAYTAEGAPSASPQDVLCTTLTAQTIRVSWVSPPLAAANGLIKAYKVVYGPSDTWYGKCPFTLLTLNVINTFSSLSNIVFYCRRKN